MVDFGMAGKYCTCIAIDFDIFFGLYKHLALKVAITVYIFLLRLVIHTVLLHKSVALKMI